MKRLFVYGTLAPGQANHGVLEGVSGNWETATLRGRLLDEGWGSEMGCPGIVPCDDGEAVIGYLLSSNDLPGLWSTLDAFEGSGYARQPVKVETENGDLVDAYVYALNRAP